MDFGLPTKSQALEIAKVAIYLSLSAGLDYLISMSTGSQFGVFTPIINIALVTIKKFISKG
jgi:hypothetical protein